MMKLILSLTLIWTLSSTAEALECWYGKGTDMKQQELLPCDSTEFTECATIAFQANNNGNLGQNTYRACFPSSHISEGKHTYSISFGLGTISLSVHVCNTDGCNSEDIPYPDILMKNNLQCFTCKDPSSAVCDKTVQCVGTEDRCINGTVQDSDERRKTYHILGCVSANLCEVSSFVKLLPLPFKFLDVSKCCGSSFCNSAWSVKLNVIPLMLGLFTLIVY